MTTTPSTWCRSHSGLMGSPGGAPVSDARCSHEATRTVVSMAGKKHPTMGLHSAVARTGPATDHPATDADHGAGAKSAHHDKVRAALKKVMQRDAELLKRLAR